MPRTGKVLYDRPATRPERKRRNPTWVPRKGPGYEKYGVVRMPSGLRARRTSK